MSTAYHVEYTSSRLITEVKQHWAELVLGWVTAWEYSVLQTFFYIFFYNSGLLQNIPHSKQPFCHNLSSDSPFGQQMSQKLENKTTSELMVIIDIVNCIVMESSEITVKVANTLATFWSMKKKEQE